ncbi:MAG: S41 family peptidase [Telluria sp.]
MKQTTTPAIKRSLAAAAAALVFALPLPGKAQEAVAPQWEQAQIALPEPEIQKLLATYALIKKNYVGQADDRKLFDGALAGMLASLDPHSQYLDGEGMRDIDRAASGEYVGIGVQLEAWRDRIRVASIVEGSPADRAGIVAGDEIVSVDGVRLANLTDSEIARHLSGAPGTVLSLVVVDRGQPRTLCLTRAALHDTTVQTRMAARGVAWIRISEFGGATGADLALALKRLDGRTPPHGLVLDLRNNPGGLVPAGVAVAGAFLPQGAVLFSARGREAGAETTVTVDPRYYRQPDEADPLADLPAWTRTVPLVVLVNGASASAAELVAGALQDHHRATVIGSRTFGKGSIQSVIPLTEDSGIKFTVARYFTPNGREIQAHGVVPDLVVAPAAAGDDALLLREEDLARHLPAIQEDEVESGRTPVEPTRMFGTRKDKALRTAVALLKPEERRMTLWGLLRRLGNSLTKGGADKGGFPTVAVTDTP